MFLFGAFENPKKPINLFIPIIGIILEYKQIKKESNVQRKTNSNN